MATCSFIVFISVQAIIEFPYELKEVAANSIGAAHSISPNIAEEYCRHSIKEYLNYLNIALSANEESSS